MPARAPRIKRNRRLVRVVVERVVPSPPNRHDGVLTGSAATAIEKPGHFDRF